MTKPCLHFVGFKNERFLTAVRTFGAPDFIHPGWDLRAAREIAPGDTVVFADGNENQEPRKRSFTDLREKDQ